MPIMYSLEDAEKRLADRGPLNEKDVRDLIPYLGAIGGGGGLASLSRLSLTKYSRNSQIR